VTETIESIALLRFVLRDNCNTDEIARRYLGDAARLGVDPLDYCAHRFGLGSDTVWRRAAEWAGYPFATITPTRTAPPRIDHLDRLGEMRSLRQSSLGAEIVFLSPRFEQVVRLGRGKPVPGVRFVPPEAIETGVTRAASGQLMDDARQRVTQLWPWASAALDLTLPVRIAFVAVLAALIGLVMAATLVARPILVPVTALLLLGPGLLRFLAALPSPGVPPPRGLADAELPVYSVLLPLRDEARMVPQLSRAMAALDYPVLWSSYT
jgi:hypothetical protein